MRGHVMTRLLDRAAQALADACYSLDQAAQRRHARKTLAHNASQRRRARGYVYTLPDGRQFDTWEEAMQHHPNRPKP